MGELKDQVESLEGPIACYQDGLDKDCFAAPLSPRDGFDHRFCSCNLSEMITPLTLMPALLHHCDIVTTVTTKVSITCPCLSCKEGCEREGGMFEAFIVEQSLSCSQILEVGNSLNLERSSMLGDQSK